MRGYWTRRPLPSFRNSTASSVSSFILLLIPGPLARPRPPVPSFPRASFISLSPDSLPAPSCPVPSLPPSLPPFFLSFFFLTPRFNSVRAFHLWRPASWCHPMVPHIILFSRSLVSSHCDGRGGAASAAASNVGVASWEIPVVRVPNGQLVSSCQMWSLGSGATLRLEPRPRVQNCCPRTNGGQELSHAGLLTAFRFPHSPHPRCHYLYFCHSEFSWHGHTFREGKKFLFFF